MRRFLVVLLALLWAVPASAATYYVRTDGNNGNVGTTNSAGGAWLTIDKCADTAVATDTCRVQAGNYVEVITPGHNGSSGAGNTITFVADGVVTFCGMTTSSNSYLRFIGFVQDDRLSGCSVRSRGVLLQGTNVGLEFWNNTFQNSQQALGMTATAQRFNNGLVIGNLFYSNGYLAQPDASSAIALYGAHNVFAYNECHTQWPDCVNFSGTHFRFQNMYHHDPTESGGGHSDFFQTDAHDLGQSENLYEANYQKGVGNLADEHVGVWQNLSPGQCDTTCGAVTGQVWRGNVWHNISTGTLGIAYGPVGDMTRNYIYNNTTATAETNESGASYGMNLSPGTDHNYVLNYLFYEAWSAASVTNITVANVVGGSTFVADYNLAYKPSVTLTFGAQWTNQVHEQSNVNPNFVNYAGDDFHLGAGSGDGANARGTGGPLTTTSGSGTGTTFNVVTNGAGFFRGSDASALPQYSGNLVAGDTITVGTDVVTVASISGDAITVTSSFTWANGESVYWGSDTTPDIGAYPYKAGGFSLSATYTNSGGTVTVTPSDASLMRYAVVYENSIPVCVLNASPFTCSVGGGTIAVRAYPLYASPTLWADAADVGAPTPPDTTPRRYRFVGNN